jgi:hypothetical protein
MRWQRAGNSVSIEAEDMVIICNLGALSEGGNQVTTSEDVTD